MTSCYKQETISSKNKVAQEQAAINSTDAIDYCDSLDNDIFEMGQTIGKFVDGLIKDGEVLFDQRNIGFNTYLDVNYNENDTIPFSEMAQLISDTFDIELSLASEFFDMLLDNKTFLVNLSTEEELALQNSILCYMQDPIDAAEAQNGSVQVRWIFSALAELFDASCGFQVAAGIADAASEAAIAVLAMPTGGGAIYMGGAAASSLIYAINTGIECP